MRGIASSAAGEKVSLDASSKRSFSDLKIVGRLQVYPIRRGGSKMPGWPDGGVGRDRAIAVTDGTDPVHRHPQIARKVIEADSNVPKIQDLPGMDGWQCLSS
jgi:hypothetical protein